MHKYKYFGPVMEILRQNRIKQFRQKLAESEFDAVLLNQVDNVRYLSGFENGDPNVAFLVITQSALILVTDYRYSQQAITECPGYEVIERDRQNVSLGQQFKIIFDQVGAKSVAFERNYIGYGMLEDIRSEVGEVKLEGIHFWVEAQRMLKDPNEIESIRQAASLADKALADLVKFMKPGITERDAALELEYQMQKAGSEGLSFPTLLISGDRTSLPHGLPSEKTLNHGDLITIDFGAVVNGYRSDMTRAFVVGQPNQKQQAVYETVRAAQRAGVEAVKADIEGKVPHFASKAILDASEFAEFQGEGLGHGVGLFLHEQPFLGIDCNIVLRENMVITVEPGIYIPGWGGVRIEDDVVVTKDGCEILTHAPRDLIVIE